MIRRGLGEVKLIGFHLQLDPCSILGESKQLSVSITDKGSKTIRNTIIKESCHIRTCG